MTKFHRLLMALCFLVGATTLNNAVAATPQSKAKKTKTAQTVTNAQTKEKIVVAYVCSWTTLRLPDPTLMTHINYAFGHVNKTFNGCDIQNEPFLRKVVALKEKNPKLKILLSIGGWTSGNFSEMAASADNRKAFAKDCRRICDEFGLDGIDIDWEYPSSGEAGISNSPEDISNYTLLMRDLRQAIGKKRLLTAATFAYGKFYNFRDLMPYMDFVNVMAYDVANPPQHHTALHRSPLSARITDAEAIEAHIKQGVPREKLVLGMPLYGRGDHGNTILDKYMKTGYTAGLYTEHWDSIGQVPYLTDWSGRLVWAADNPRSIAAKCQYILDENLLGGMYWETTEDNAQQDLMNTVYLSLLKNKKATVPQKQVLLITNGYDSKQIHDIKDKAAQMGFAVSELHTGDQYEPLTLERYHLLINMGTDPEVWRESMKTEFEKYIDEAQGSYMAVDADTTKTWKWYNTFYRNPELKHARNIFYKKNAPFGSMPRLEFYDEFLPKALRWLLHE